MTDSPGFDGADGQMRQDAEIIRRVVEGDVNAFEGLIERYRSLVFGIVLKYVPWDRADDVAQEAFIETYRSLGSFSERSSFGTWLSKITVRCCYRFWREYRHNREMPLSSLSEEPQRWLDDVLSAPSREAFEREAVRAEAAEVLNFALGRLSAEDRMVVAMVHLEGLSTKETAALLGWSTVTVKVRAHRSRQKLRKIISSLLEEAHDKRGGA